MEGILKSHLKFYEAKLMLASGEKKTELESKISDIKKQLNIRDEKETIHRPNRIQEVFVPVVEEPVVEPIVVVEEPVVEPVEEVLPVVEELVTIEEPVVVEELVTIEESVVEEQAEEVLPVEEPIDFKFEKEFFIGTPDTDEQTEIDSTGEVAEEAEDVQESIEEEPTIKKPRKSRKKKGD